MVDTQSGAFSTPKLHELNTLMEKRRSELKQLKEGRLKATHLVRIARNSFSLGDGGTPAAVRTQTGLSTPFYNASGSRGQDIDAVSFESPTTAIKKVYSASSELPVSHQDSEELDSSWLGNDVEEDVMIQNVSDAAQAINSQTLKEAREECDDDEKFIFTSSQRTETELDTNESLTALRAKLDEYDEVDRVTREADERMVELCDNLARSKQELETAQRQLRDASNEVAIKREENLSLSRELHDALHRVEEFEQNERTVRTEEKEWQDKQQSNAAATEEELIQLRKKLALEKQKNRTILAKEVAAAQQGSQGFQCHQPPSLIRVFLVLVGWIGALGCCVALLVVTGGFSSCSVDIVRHAY